MCVCVCVRACVHSGVRCKQHTRQHVSGSLKVQFERSEATDGSNDNARRGSGLLHEGEAASVRRTVSCWLLHHGTGRTTYIMTTVLDIRLFHTHRSIHNTGDCAACDGDDATEMACRSSKPSSIVVPVSARVRECVSEFVRSSRLAVAVTS